MHGWKEMKQMSVQPAWTMEMHSPSSSKFGCCVSAAHVCMESLKYVMYHSGIHTPTKFGAVSRSLFRPQGSRSEGKKYLHSRLIVVSSIHYQLFFPRPTMDKVTWNSIGEDNSRVFWHPNAFAQIPPWDNAHPILECTLSLGPSQHLVFFHSNLV